MKILRPYPANWTFLDFNTDTEAAAAFVEASVAGSTSVPYRQNRVLIFDSMMLHKSNPFRFKKGGLGAQCLQGEGGRGVT